jgi:hypothetical protein
MKNKTNRTRRITKEKTTKSTKSKCLVGGNHTHTSPPVSELVAQRNAIRQAVVAHFPEYIFEIDKTRLYVYEHENGVKYPMYKIMATKEQSDKENRDCFSFWAYERTVHINTIDRCVKTTSTKYNLRKFIAMIQSITTPKYDRIEIGDDDSRLWFECPATTDDTSNDIIYPTPHDVSLSLAQLYLLQYGQTYYNSFGFGRQSEEWAQFIQQPIHSFLESIKFFQSEIATSHPSHIAAIPTDDTSIQNYFKACMNRMRNRNYCVDGFVYYMSSLLEYIFHRAPNLPTFNRDLTLLI